MANIIKLKVGSLGCLGGGEGNLRDVSHDSTCSCEGCVEKRLAAREFSINTENFGERDYGFNAGDEGGPDAPADTIVLSDDNDELESVSFDVPNSPDDDGYCDDGEDSEDTYSVFSPKPYTIDEQNTEAGSDDDIEEEDTPPVSVEDAINDASIEASEKAGQVVEECLKNIENEGHETIQLRRLHTILDEERVKAASFWKRQIERYEAQISSQFKTISSYAEGIRAAKRRMDYDAHEIRRLRDLVMEKTEEVNKKDERIYNLTDEMCLMESGYQYREKRKQRAFKELARQFDEKAKLCNELQTELKVTRERLNTLTRRSVPRRQKRLRRRVATYDDGDEESSISLGSCSDTEYEDDDTRTSKLVKIMNE